MPRPSHPSVNPEVQEAFLKTFPNVCNKPYKPETAMTPDQYYYWQPTREDLVGVVSSDAGLVSAWYPTRALVSK